MSQIERARCSTARLSGAECQRWRHREERTVVRAASLVGKRDDGAEDLVREVADEVPPPLLGSGSRHIVHGRRRPKYPAIRLEPSVHPRATYLTSLEYVRLIQVYISQKNLSFYKKEK